MRTPTRRPVERLRTSTPDDQDRAIAARTMPPAAGIEPDLWLMHVCYARHPDAELRRVLVEEYQGYALSVARRMHRDGEPIEDLRQVALEALLVSLNRFDPERRYPFLGFASLTITGALKRHYRDFGWLLRVPRRVHELTKPIRFATDELTGKLGRTPTLEELAARLDVDVETLIQAQEAARARSLGSLSAEWEEGGNETTVPGDVDPGYEHSIERLDLRRALTELGDDERYLLNRYFFEECTQTELAEELGVSQMQVSRMLRSVTRRLAVRTAELV